MTNLQAYFLPHPPLAVPSVGGGQEIKIEETLRAFDEVAREIAKLAPEVIVFITPHTTIYTDYFHISPNERASGSLSRFGAPKTRFEAEYDVELAKEIARKAEENGIAAGFEGERDASLDHGVTVPMWYINQHFSSYKIVRIGQSGFLPEEHYLLGRLIAEAAEKTGKKAVLIASGDLSHKLSDDGPYGIAPEGVEFDALVCNAFSNGDLHALFNISNELRAAAGECGYGSAMVMAGFLSGHEVKARLLSYECPFGVGYAVASFESVALKQAAPVEQNPYVALARSSLEHYVQTGQMLPIPSELPKEMLENQAGAFVSLHKHGHLRGCIGTIAKATPSIAHEVVKNAVSAGAHDPRFEPTALAELPFLTYKVDILAEPEIIESIDQLDVKRYGVIVSSGNKRGLLLPNLDGIDTVEEQVAIAKNKAGIKAGAPCTLERFEVIRHE
ncbi:MAG: AmmeMemoRadiSam system protein A [Defluviitaleaceae bacterium]|nr:AmmeMemoRadiSam system protein A [Defluviitaleaceae bacterium]